MISKVKRIMQAPCLILLVVMLLANTAFADDSAGKTIMARGDVSATNENEQRQLVRREPVFMTDKVKTGVVSATQLRMIDGGLLSLQEDTELAINTYAFNAQDKRVSVSMELIKGGLRTVTGTLQMDQSDYRLKTPIASIGVRGTHYEAELFEGDLYLAGWEGVIDIVVDVNNRQFALGPDQEYKFAIVRSDGSVDFLLAVPTQFAQGHSSDLLTREIPVQSLNEYTGVLNQPTTQPNIVFENSSAVDNTGEDFIDNDLLVSRILPDELIVSRTGTATFDVLANSDFTSSVGTVENVNISITVDFNNASVPTGNLSFSDSDGEWFAAFNGLINATSLDVNVNFASHNNNLADGIINGLFIDDATGILGNVNLFEIAQPGVNAGGSFLLLDSVP